MNIEVGKDEKISIYRERRVTKQEKQKDSDADLMCEWVHITFSDNEPVIKINRDLCNASG